MSDQIQGQFAEIGSYLGFDGRSLESLEYGDQVRHHGFASNYVVIFEGWTGEIALPRERGAVARFSFAQSGHTDTAVAGELSLLPQ